MKNKKYRKPKKINKVKKYFGVFNIIIIVVLIFSLVSGLYYFFNSSFDLRKSASTDEVIFTDQFENAEPLGWSNIKATGGSSIIVDSSMKYSGQNSLKVTKSNTGSSAVVGKQLNNPSIGVVSAYFYDDLSTNVQSYMGAQIGSKPNKQTISIGVRTSIYPDTYWIRNGKTQDSYNLNSYMTRTKGWHKFTLVITQKGTYAMIDDIALSFLPLQTDATGINPNMRQFNYLFIANIQKGTTSHWDSVNVSIPNYMVSTPNNTQDIEEYFLNEYVLTYPNPKLYSETVGLSDTGRVRFITHQALIYSTLYRRTSKIDYLNKAKSSIQDLINNKDKLNKNDRFINEYDLGLAAGLIWDKLSSTQKSEIENIVITTANRVLLLTPESNYKLDSRSENNSMKIPIVTLAHYMFGPSDEWNFKIKQFSNHLFTTDKSNIVYGVGTKNLHDSFLFDNHNAHPHPLYVHSTIGNKAKALVTTRSYKPAAPWVGKSTVSGMTNLWNAHKKFYSFNNSNFNPNLDELLLNSKTTNYNISGETNDLWKYRGKDDSGADLSWHNHSLALLKILNIDNSIYDRAIWNEYYLRRDYLAYPKFADGVFELNSDNRPCTSNDVRISNLGGKYCGKNSELKRSFINIVVAVNHTYALLLTDPSIKIQK